MLILEGPRVTDELIKIEAYSPDLDEKVTKKSNATWRWLVASFFFLNLEI